MVVVAFVVNPGIAKCYGSQILKGAKWVYIDSACRLVVLNRHLQNHFKHYLYSYNVLYTKLLLYPRIILAMSSPCASTHSYSEKSRRSITCDLRQCKIQQCVPYVRKCKGLLRARRTTKWCKVMRIRYRSQERIETLYNSKIYASIAAVRWTT